MTSAWFFSLGSDSGAFPGLDFLHCPCACTWATSYSPTSISRRHAAQVLRHGARHAFQPGYWGLMSLGAWKGFLQLLTKPHFWEKTIHGLNVEKEGEQNA
jgi:hypothetical protein